MADQDQVNPDQVTPEEPKDVKTQIEAAVAEVTKSLTERYKSEISGLNRKNGEVMTELDELRKSSMSDKEKLQFDLEKEKAELAASRTDFVRMQNKAKAISKASELGVPIELLDPLSMDNWDTIDKQIDKFKTVVDGMKTKAADEFARSNGDTLKSPATLTSKKASELTASELSKIFKENPEEGKALLAARQKG